MRASHRAFLPPRRLSPFRELHPSPHAATEHEPVGTLRGDQQKHPWPLVTLVLLPDCAHLAPILVVLAILACPEALRRLLRREDPGLPLDNGPSQVRIPRPEV